MASDIRSSVRESKASKTYVALLRGINVGGKNKLAMKDLVGLFEELGCRDVHSYIQSGNIVFRAPDLLACRVPALVAARIEKSYQFLPPVLVRSAVELKSVNAHNPFLQPSMDPEALHVVFLEKHPKAEHVLALDPLRSPPDKFAVRGREIYLSLPNGGAKTKLTNAYFDSKLRTISTVRNWNTVQKLIALTEG